jgi:hypothetical protein
LWVPGLWPEVIRSTSRSLAEMVLFSSLAQSRHSPGAPEQADDKLEELRCRKRKPARGELEPI